MICNAISSSGLAIEMNIEQDQYVEGLSEEAGVNVIIHNARQMPFPYDEGITVPPGFSTSIAMRKVRFTLEFYVFP
jgi:hypothetical protein